MSRFRRFGLRSLALFALGLLAAALVGCRLITPAELEQFGTHQYEGRSRGQVMHATLAALRAQGYAIASVDEDAGRVKTSPKVVSVTAASTGYGTAAAMASELAWTIDVEGRSSGAVL